MIKVKDAAVAAAKFKTRASSAAPDYAAGVKDAGESWKAGASSPAAAENYQAGVNAAIARGAFQKGVSAAGSDKYVRNASGIGSRRFSEGVTNAEGDYNKGVSPYLDAMRNFTFSTPRRPKGDPANWQRSQELGLRLRAVKTGQ
jgi:hypothetical protein